MAHKTLVDGTAYEISGGKTLIGGTGYKIDSGKTLVDGTVYKISFAPPGKISFMIEDVGSFDATSGMTWADWGATSEGSYILSDWENLVWLNSGGYLCDSGGDKVFGDDLIIDLGIYHEEGA